MASRRCRFPATRVLSQLLAAVAVSAITATASLAQQIGPNVDVGQGAEGTIAINPTDPTNLVAAANGFYFWSLDAGRTWANAFTSPLDVCCDSNVAYDSVGTAYLQGLGFGGAGQRGIRIGKSTDEGQTYQMSWAFNDPNGAADQGFMAVETQAPTFQGNIYVVWSEYGASRCQGGSNAGNFCSEPANCPAGTCVNTLPTFGNQRVGFPLVFARSTDGGATFSTPIDISDSCNFQEHSSNITTGPNGEVYVVWFGCGKLMFDKSLDGGLTWGVDKVAYTLPSPTNAFPLTDDVRGNSTVAVDRSTGPFRGTIYASGIDTNVNGGAADAWIVRSTDGGNGWSAPVLLSDGPRGAYKYYFQPRIAVSPGGRVDAAWYDTRFNTSTDTNNVTYDVFATYSNDGAATFKPNLRVTSTSSVKITQCPMQGPCGYRVLYEYIGLGSDETRAFPLWTDMRTGSQHQFTSTINLRHARRCGPHASGCGGG